MRRTPSFGFLSALSTVFVAGLVAVVGSGCSEPCCQFDGQPIAVARAGDGALILRASTTGTPTGSQVFLDTAAPVTLWHTETPATPARATRADLRVFDAVHRDVLRARFDGVLGVATPLPQPPGPGESILGVLGGEFLRSFTLFFDGGADAIILWDGLPASTTFLSAHGYAVMRVDPFGGGQLDAHGEPDLLGQTAPYQFPASQLVLRACAAAEPPDPDAGLPAQCCAGDDRRLATGVDLALVLGTGWGPLVLSESAWQRVRAADPMVADATQSGALQHPAFGDPIPARLGTLPRIAFVDRETTPNDDPGPCVELGRARRLEVVAKSQATAPTQPPERALCVPACDQDPRNRPRARDSAAYLDLGDDVPVAVVSDLSPVLQGLRTEIRPEGPEIDGIAGAAVFSRAQFEIDYRSRPMRVAFACPADAQPQTCRAIGRCPRLPKVGATRLCFGLPEHGLPKTCEDQPAACPP